MAAKLRLDHGGIAAVLKSGEVGGVIHDAAASVAAGAVAYARNGDEIPVEMDYYVTDRVAAGVTLAHPAGLGKEAKYGTLARAAASAGLEVTSRRGA